MPYLFVIFASSILKAFNDILSIGRDTIFFISFIAGFGVFTLLSKCLTSSFTLFCSTLLVLGIYVGGSMLLVEKFFPFDIILKPFSFFVELLSIQGGGGGEVSLRKSVVQSACQYHVVRSRDSDFQNGEQSVHRRDG